MMIIEERESSDQSSQFIYNNDQPMHIDSARRSAFLPYKPAVAVLTNMQRGNTSAQTSYEPRELTIFQLAAKGELSQLDIGKVANINAFDQEDEGLTLLMWASAYCQAHTVACLLENGADANWQNSKGQTALHFAAKSGSPEVVKTLLAFGANIDSIDERGNSALIFATKYNHPETVHLLLANDANLACANAERESAHHIAVRLKRDEIQYLLENNMKQRLTGNIAYIVSLRNCYAQDF